MSMNNNPCNVCILNEAEKQVCTGCPQKIKYNNNNKQTGCPYIKTCDSHTTTCSAFPPEQGCLLYKVLKNKIK